MTQFLIRRFLKNTDLQEEKTRIAAGVMAGAVGIACNLALFFIKIVTGLLVRSMSVVADAFNNFSDAGSSVISLLAARASGKPADQEHPFGHGRIEYVASLAVSFLIIDVGLRLFQSSFQEIRDPRQMQFSWPALVILILSVGIKLWLSIFNKKLGKMTKSGIMHATAVDSFFDALTTGVTIFSLLIYQLSGTNVDGYAGMIVSAFVIWAGIGVARDTIHPLIGGSVSAEECEQIRRIAREQEKVINVHDLVVHDYGHGRQMATLHVELPRNMLLSEAHGIADRIEKEVRRQTGVMLVVHVDPADIDDLRVRKLKERTEKILKILDPALHFHDFQVAFDQPETAVMFDLEIPYNYSKEKETQVINQFVSFMGEFDPKVSCTVTADRGFFEDTGIDSE